MEGLYNVCQTDERNIQNTNELNIVGEVLGDLCEQVSSQNEVDDMEGLYNICQTDERNIQNTNELNIVREVLGDLCEQVSSLNEVDTNFQGNANGIDSDCTTDTVKVQPLHCVTGLCCENNAETLINGIKDSGHKGLAGSVASVDKTAMVNKQNMENGEPVYESSANLPQDILAKSKRCNVSEQTTSITNNNIILPNDALSGAETLSKVVAMDRSCCQLTDNYIKENQSMNDVHVTVHTCVSAQEEISDKEGQKDVVSSKWLSDVNINDLPLKNVADRDGIVDDLMYVMSIAQGDLQYLKRLSEDTRVIPDNNSRIVNDDDSSLSSSDSETTSSSELSSDESDSESVNTLKASTANIILDDEGESENITKCLPKTKDEVLLSELPPPDPVEIVADKAIEIKPLGEIESILKDTALVIIKSFPDVPALDSDSILFCEDRSAFGQVFDTFGQVKSPHYCVRFDNEEHLMGRNFCIGQPVYYAPDTTELTNFVFTSKLQSMKGSDASWRHDQEPPEEIVAYSDDEAESNAKSARRKANKLKKRNENNDLEVRSKSDKKSCVVSQTCDQHPANQTATHETNPQRPKSSWADNPIHSGDRFPQGQDPALFSWPPRFDSQPNYWSPPMPEQPRRVYNGSQYYQETARLQQPQQMPPLLRLPHQIPPYHLQQPLPPPHLQHPQHQSQQRPPLLLPHQVPPHHFQQPLPPPHLQRPQHYAPQLGRPQHQIPPHFPQPFPPPHPRHHRPPTDHPLPPPTTQHLCTVRNLGQPNQPNQIPFQVRDTQQSWSPRMDIHNDYNKQHFPYPPR